MLSECIELHESRSFISMTTVVNPFPVFPLTIMNYGINKSPLNLAVNLILPFTAEPNSWHFVFTGCFVDGIIRHNDMTRAAKASKYQRRN